MPPRKKNVNATTSGNLSNIVTMNNSTTEVHETVPKKTTRVTKKKTITEQQPQEHVIVKLPIAADRLNSLINGDTIDKSEPMPYEDVGSFTSENSVIDTEPTDISLTTPVCCFWCCHSIEAQRIGMPISYDINYNTFSVFGTFCSLECASAYNFATNQGSDRVWEINSWIQLLARSMNIKNGIRPAPSRYALKMFGGTLTINKFREAHKTLSRSYVLNIPPLITINTQIEAINTSFMMGDNEVLERTKLSRSKPIIEYTKTLEGKMKVKIDELPT